MKLILTKLLENLRNEIVNQDDFQCAYFDFHRNRYYFLLNLINGLAGETQGRILDLGANPYHLSRCLQKMGFTVAALNYDSGKIEKRAEETGILIKNSDLAKGRIDYSDNFFDYVLFSETLEHLNFHPGTIINEINRVLKPGGKCIITTPNQARANNRIKLFLGRSIYYPLDEPGITSVHYREYTKIELIDLLKSANFIINRSDYIDFNYPGNLVIKIINRLFCLFNYSLKPNLVLIASK